MEVIMKKRDVVLRISLLGLVAVVLGTAAAMGGSEGGMVRMTRVEVGMAGEVPTALKLPEEMTEEEKLIFARVGALRAERTPAVRSEAEFPYGCELDAAYFMGNAYWKRLLTQLTGTCSHYRL